MSSSGFTAPNATFAAPLTKILVGDAYDFGEAIECAASIGLGAVKAALSAGFFTVAATLARKSGGIAEGKPSDS